MFEKEVENYKDDMIKNLMDIIKYPSVSELTNDPEKPLGEECKKVLEHVLELGKQMGFRTKNVDGYCGYIEFGEGEELLGIIGHLDVVPAFKDDGWNTNPFEGVIKDGKLYGRGAIDDKGPVIASLYAMKIVLDNCKVNKRVRLILGLSEETTWHCINHYKEKEEFPTISFSPDAEFPCIYAEKGIFNGNVKFELDLGDGVKILDTDCKNNAINVVPKYASITIECDNAGEKSKFMNLNNINTIEIDDKTLKLEAFGISAHGAYPYKGDNAITKLLLNLPKNETIEKLNEEGFFEIESPKYLGGKETIDESGDLTSNIAIIKNDNNQISLDINFRVPVLTDFEYVDNKMKQLQNISSVAVKLENKNPKLYVPKDSFLVKTLSNVFYEETGIDVQPIATGGGSYARAFENCVAFGAIMPGEEETYHQANEYIDINNMICATKIYARAIYELAK